MNVRFYTLGCKVNQYETEVMMNLFDAAGYEVLYNDKQADIIIINSCTVTGESDNKDAKLLRRCRRENPDSVIALTGCFPQAFPEECKKLLEYADIICGNSKRAEIVDLVEHFMETKQKIINVKEYTGKDKYEALKINKFHYKARAFIKIEDGCNRFCTYCIIPYARGRVRSKSLKDIKEEVEMLAGNGFKEIALVGINLSSYGMDNGLSLCDVVEAIESIDGIERVRLGSLEPDLITDEMIAKFVTYKKLCPQFHLSLQSGSDQTLKRMNRHYNTDQYRHVVNALRKAYNNPAITTDLMTGFAGETEDLHKESIDFVKEIEFAKVHVFPYSQRKGTKADLYEDQVDVSVREKRCKEAIEAAAVARTEFLKSHVGKRYDVLFETKDKNGYYEGYCSDYSRVLIKSDENLAGVIKNVLIIDSNDEHCYAEK